MQVHAHRRLRACQHLRDLARRQVFLHVQQQRRPLLGREPIDLAPDLRHQPLTPEQVGRIGRGPRLPLEEAAALGILALVPDREPLPPAAASPVIQAEVDQDPIEPGGELRLAAEARGRPIHAEKRFLREVAGVLGVAQQRPRQPVRAPLVPGDQHVEGRLVLGRDPRQQRFIRCLLTQRGLWGQPSHSSLAGSKHPDPGPAGPARVG